MSLIPGPFSLVLVKDPTGFCAICEKPFYAEAEMRAHFQTAEHAESLEREVNQERERRDRVAFMYEDPDPEVTAHMRKVGRRMKQEGRLTTKPSERAGFS